VAGWEFALSLSLPRCIKPSCHTGLPEVTLGCSGGGGVGKKCLGSTWFYSALPFLTRVGQFKPEEGPNIGLINEIVNTQQLIDAAVTSDQSKP